MRITVVGPLPPILGGISAHTRGAIGALRALGHEVHPIGYSRLFPHWIAGKRPGTGTPPGATIIDGAIDCYAPRTWLGAAARVRELRSDLVLAQYWSPVAAAAISVVLSRAGSAMRVLVCHNLVPHERLPGATMVARQLIRRCDGIIFHSRHVRDRALSLAGTPPPSKVVGMPLLLGGDAPVDRPPPEILASWMRGMRLFVSAGHLRRYKGLADLAAAWHRATPSADALLVVAGEWLSSPSDARALHKLGSRVLVIPRYLDDDELTWLLANAEAVLMPYARATQSGLLPTALRLARDLVVSNAGGLCEQLPTEGGPSVTVVPVGDRDALAAAIRARVARPACDGALGRNGASRHATIAISSKEQLASWGPFVSALGALLRAHPPSRSSNSVAVGSSESLVEARDRERAAGSWYDAAGPAF